MACPLFIPTSPLGELVSVAPPLGDLYDGYCAAEPAAAIDHDTLRRYCNFGYARGHCAKAMHSDADAVRLLVYEAHGSLVQISWAVERNHHPVAVGRLEVETGHARERQTDPLGAQTYACAAAYVRQTSGNPGWVDRSATAAHP